MIIMAALAAVTLGGAGGIFFMLHRAPPHIAVPEGGDEVAKEGDKSEKKSEGGHEEAAAPKEGESFPTIKLDPAFVANLTDEAGEQHYLKISLVVELSSAKFEKVLESRTPKLRNAILLYLSGLRTGDTVGVENKKAMIEHLRSNAQDVLGKGSVRDIYLTEFVIQ